MGEDIPNVDLPSVVMNSCDQPELAASDIEDGQPADLIGGGKRGPQASEGCIVGFADDGEPVLQRGPRVGMEKPEIHQPFARDDMHRRQAISW